MQGYLALTDESWYEFHKMNNNRNLFFWKPTTEIYNFLNGTDIYFLVKSKPRFIGGKAAFVHKGVGTVEEIWNRYNYQVGHNSINILLSEMNKKRGSNGMLTKISMIGYYELENAIYFNEPIYPDKTYYRSTGKQIPIDVFGPIEYHHANVRGQYLKTSQTEWIEVKSKGINVL